MRDKVLSDLPEAAKRLVREMQRIHFGRIEGLVVRDGLPVFEPKPDVYREIRIGANVRARPATAAGNFHLTVDIPCRLVAVEKEEPYRCGVWLVTAALLDDHALENRRAIEELRYCRDSGVWPTRYEEGRTLYA